MAARLSLDDLVACFLIRLHALGKLDPQYPYREAEAPSAADAQEFVRIIVRGDGLNRDAFAPRPPVPPRALSTLAALEACVSAPYAAYLRRCVNHWLRTLVSPDAIVDAVAGFHALLGAVVEPSSQLGKRLRAHFVRFDTAMFSGLSALFSAVQGAGDGAAAPPAPAGDTRTSPPSLADEMDEVHGRFDRAVVPMVAARSGAVARGAPGPPLYTNSSVTQYGCLEIASVHAARGQTREAAAGGCPHSCWLSVCVYVRFFLCGAREREIVCVCACVLLRTMVSWCALVDSMVRGASVFCVTIR